MLLGGDELNRTQRGNNNAWCQDSEISWYDWNTDGAARELHDFTRRLIRLRREHCTFRRETFLSGQEVDEAELPDVWWFRIDGRRMTGRDWEHGEAVLGMLFNAHAEDRQFRLPRRIPAERWELELCTADPGAAPASAAYDAGELVTVTAHSITILKQVG
jgi:glycogen operon protein